MNTRKAALLLACSILATAQPSIAALPCAARAAVPGQDDWCEDWVTSTGFWTQGSMISTSGEELITFGVDLTTQRPELRYLVAADGTLTRSIALTAAVPGITYLYAMRILQDPSTQNVILAGAVRGRLETEDGFQHYFYPWFAAYDLEGRKLWERPLPPSSSEPGAFGYPTALTVSDSGTIGALILDVSGEDVDLRIVGLAGDGGSIEWDHTSRVDGIWGSGQQLIIDDEGGVFTSTLRDAGVVRVEGLRVAGTDLVREWLTERSTLDFKYARGGMELTQEGSLVLMGYDLRDAPYAHIAALALDASSGEAIWRTTMKNFSPQVGVVVDGDEPSIDAGLRQVHTSGLPLHLEVDAERAFLVGNRFEWDVQYGVLTPVPAQSLVVGAVDLSDGSLLWRTYHKSPYDRILFPTLVAARRGTLLVHGTGSDCNFYFAPYPCTTQIQYSSVTLALDVASGDLARIGRYNHIDPLGPELQPSAPAGTGWDLVLSATVGTDGRLVSALASRPGWCGDECYGNFRFDIISYIF